MTKKLFFVFVFVVVVLTHTRFVAADYRLTNGSTTETVWAAYSVWHPVSWNWPAGWRTQGWYKIEPRDTQTLQVPQDNARVYIRVIDQKGREIKPHDSATRDRFLFWIHPSQKFAAVETNEGDFLKGDHPQWRLKQENLYEYRNGGSHTLQPNAGQNLPDLPAQQIYNQVIHSVVLILTDKGSGSGVLIDKERRLVVTNQHVTGNAAEVTVVFPYRDQNGKLQKDIGFYAKNIKWLVDNNYATQGRIIAQNRSNDLAIVQLDWLPSTAREIQHDFSRNVEDSMRQGDKVHILGNPRDRLWNWTQGTFLRQRQVCLMEGGTLVGCLEMEGDTHGGNSGGPVLNGQGVLIGILTAGTDETLSLAATTRNIKALLATVPAHLPLVSSEVFAKRTFRIRNRTGVTVHYQIRWSDGDNWQRHSLETGYIKTHWSDGQNIPSDYPKIQFDHIAGDQAFTERIYKLETVQFRENNDHAPIYYFQYNQWGNRLDLFRDVRAAPALSKTAPEATILFSNYPNPFNPETWIPYQLAKPAKVRVSIYSADGQLVRTLKLGHQPAGVYQSKSRAAYWDGKNELGEPVASGVYFYMLTAGGFTATRRLLILK